MIWVFQRNKNSGNVVDIMAAAAGHGTGPVDPHNGLIAFCRQIGGVKGEIVPIYEILVQHSVFSVKAAWLKSLYLEALLSKQYLQFIAGGAALRQRKRII